MNWNYLLTIEKIILWPFFLSKKKMILYKFLKQSLDQPAIKRREEKENRLVVIYQAHPPRDLSSD